jgi:hypothetical protein
LNQKSQRPSGHLIVRVIAWWNSKTPYAVPRITSSGQRLNIIASEFERRSAVLKPTSRLRAVSSLMREPRLTRRGHYASARNAKSLRGDKMPSVSQRERMIGHRERAFDLQKQVCFEITRGLAHLNRQLQLADPSQRFKIEKQISAAEIRLTDARERFEDVAAELREAYAWRGGTMPLVDTGIEVESKASVFEEQSELVRQFGLETAVRKVEEDAIPYATKLAVTTNFAVGQVFKKQPEAVAAEPVTLPEKIAACELKINRIRSEIDYASELLRPARLAQASSRLGELRAAKSPEVLFAEEQLSAKKADLAELIALHKTLLAQRGSLKTAACN